MGPLSAGRLARTDTHPRGVQHASLVWVNPVLGGFCEVLSHGKWGEKFACQRPAGIKIYRDLAGRFQEAFNYILKCELGHGPAHVLLWGHRSAPKASFLPQLHKGQAGVAMNVSPTAWSFLLHAAPSAWSTSLEWFHDAKNSSLFLRACCDPVEMSEGHKTPQISVRC